jgi:succinate dehydrogenase/fumarate reductase flavoprotein subunit
MAEIDVVVVGSGAAGLSAALAAQEEGARVMVVEAEPVVGGATRLSSGMVMAADTPVQRAAGLEDSAERLYQEYMLVNQYEPQPGLVRRLAGDSGETIAWLIDLGVRFLPSVMQGGGELVPRTHVPESPDVRHGGGERIVEVMHRRCRERKVEIALGRRVDRLLVRGDAVTGVAVGDDELEAGAVVLATGGFGANRSLIDEYLPMLAQHGEWISYNGPDSSRGDVFALVEQVGARIVGYDRCVQSLKPKMKGKEFDAYLPAWILVVDPTGRRLFDETAPYGITYVRVNAVGGHVFGIFDAQTRADNASPELPTLKTEYPPGTPLPSPIWNPDGITRLIESGAIVETDTLEALAEALGVPSEAMIGTVRRYNELVTLGEDRDFGKPSRFLRRIERPPFYGVEILTARVGPTACGPQIDDTAGVLGETGAAIKGLFAAGECTGGVIGSSYVGSGNSLASAFVFGRTAGRSAAFYALAVTPA